MSVDEEEPVKVFMPSHSELPAPPPPVRGVGVCALPVAELSVGELVAAVDSIVSARGASQISHRLRDGWLRKVQRGHALSVVVVVVGAVVDEGAAV